MRTIRVIPTVYTPARDLEWCAAAMAFAFGLVLALPGNTFSTGAHWLRFAAIMPEGGWAFMMVSLALVRMAALTINGRWRRTPLLRAICAVLGAAVWGYVALLMYAPFAGGIQTGVGVYTVAALADIWSAYRSGRDIPVAARVHAWMRDNPPAPLPRGFVP
ncbi:hypothetical protein [Methylobacterium indicum]|uniref:Uncharacterized protein n=1 Tax=Methylobacterium indicum TaxID=1775910 RepID=A0A8H9C6P1_9HYPH|nr:hypothetical protein [Methylobacterium indicum]BCM83570.1 hypothetical protein mvi_20310 [Methylobacterium indicum]